MPTLVNWDKCCGCGACASKCTKSAIKMAPNEEGFLHPSVNSSLCVECGACEKVCPGLMPANASNNNPKAFVVQHKNESVRYQSTSGGAFTAIAEEIIARGGVVFGAVFTEGLVVKHELVDKINNLSRFRNSKYVQSEIGGCYVEAKNRLKLGQWVCFSGTPCQINGLYKYLGTDYENLITVDVVCKSVPSPLIFSKYVEYKREQEGKISDIVFRDKKRGFLYCTMAHYSTHDDRMISNSIYRRGSESDEWLRLFLSGKISRHSCMSCQYQTIQRTADFTLGDIWETGFHRFDDNKGTTLVHVWTEKGLAFIESIHDHMRCQSYPIEKSRGTQRDNSKLKSYSLRGDLFRDANTLSATAFFKKYAPNTVKIRIKQIGRYMIWRLHLHDTVRHFKHLVIHRQTNSK